MSKGVPQRYLKIHFRSWAKNTVYSFTLQRAYDECISMSRNGRGVHLRTVSAWIKELIESDELIRVKPGVYRYKYGKAHLKLLAQKRKTKKAFKQMAINYNEGSIKELLKDEPDEIITQICDHYDIKPSAITTASSGAEGASTSIVRGGIYTNQELGLNDEEKRCMFGNPPQLAPYIALTEDEQLTKGDPKKESLSKRIAKGIREMLVWWGK